MGTKADEDVAGVGTRPPREVWRRWTPKLTQGGWTPVSDYFLESYRRLGLTTPEAMLVIQIMRHKWDEAPPRPSFKTLARRMGISDIAVRGHARQLQKKGCLRRINRVGQSNLFDLTPLFENLERLQAEDRKKAERLSGQAEEVMQAIEQLRAEEPEKMVRLALTEQVEAALERLQEKKAKAELVVAIGGGPEQ